jgi:hypothetical protein
VTWLMGPRLFEDEEQSEQERRDTALHERMAMRSVQDSERQTGRGCDEPGAVRPRQSPDPLDGGREGHIESHDDRRSMNHRLMQRWQTCGHGVAGGW